MKRCWFVLLVSACGSDGHALRDSSVETSPDVLNAIAAHDSAPAHRYVEPSRSILTNEQVGRLAIPFQENDGQWPDDVAFKADHFAGSLWVTNEGSIVYSLLGPEAEETSPSPNSFQLGSSTLENVVTDPFGLHRAPSSLVEVIERSSSPINVAPGRAAHEPFERHHERSNRSPAWTLVEHFVHGHPHRPRGLDPAVTNVSYFIGNDESKWAPHVSTFGALTLGEVWPGIEVRLVARGNNVEKFFHVSPHRDPSLIEMSIEGADSLRLSEDSSLIATTGNGEVELSPPVAYQDIDGERREVDVRYELLRDDSYRFILGDYDRSHEVVVDPILQSTYLGGSAIDSFDAVIVTATNEVLVAGVTVSVAYPGVGGGAQSMTAGNEDIVLSRFSHDLTTLIQSTFLGGSGTDLVTSMVELSLGDVVVTGTSNALNFPGTAGGLQPNLAGNDDIVLSRLTPGLTVLVQSTYIGGAGWDRGQSVTQGPTGDLFVAGSSSSINYPGTAMGLQSSGTGDGNSDIVVSRVSADLLTLVQSTYLGSTRGDAAYAIVTDGVGAVVVAGSSWSPSFPNTAGGAQPVHGNSFPCWIDCNDIVVARMAADLRSLGQTTYVGGTGDDVATSMALDSSGNIVIGGWTQSSDYPGVLAGAQTVFGGNVSDAVVTRVSSDLRTLQRSTYVGGNGADYAFAMALTSSDEVLVAGQSSSTNFPQVTMGAQSAYGGGFDVVVARLSADLGTLHQSTYIGRNNQDIGWAITFDVLGTVLVAGRSASADYPGVTGGAQLTQVAGDGFVSRLTADLRGCTDDNGCLTSSLPGVLNPAGGPIFVGRSRCDTATAQCRQCILSADCEDGNLCTTNTCNVGLGTCITTNISAGTTCRAGTDLCDLAETCPGGGAPCPANALRPNGFSCRASTGTCDLAETCDGLSASCPPDTNYASSATVCRISAGLCDLTENCTGSSNICPINAFASPATLCRAASGECDVAEFCNGTTAPCPNDGFDSSGTSCTGGVCNGTNMCVECVLPADCDDGNPCTTNTCVSNSCQTMNVSAGTACGGGLSCNGNGSCTGCSMPSQCADGNECTIDLCNLGTCSNPPAAEGASCASGVCETDGTPSCVECVSNVQCSGATPSCNIATHTCVGCIQNSDCDDGNACTNDLCNLGSCTRDPLAEGVSCPGGLCSASGMCIQCLSGTDCSGATPLCDVTTNQCVDCTSPNVTCPNGTRCDSNTRVCVPIAGCTIDSECASPTPICNVVTGSCIGCSDGGIVCPSNLLCDPDTGRCGLDPNQDADNDGILNGVECAPLNNCPDTDGDSTPDYLDPDDDGDSVPTVTECPNPTACLETDGDGTLNYLDPDDDGDGISTLYEVNDGQVFGSDIDLDGIPNYLSTDSDGDGSSDRVEGRNNSPNSIPAYLDENFLGGGGIGGGAFRCSLDTQFNESSPWPLLFCAISLAFVRRRHPI